MLLKICLEILIALEIGPYHPKQTIHFREPLFFMVLVQTLEIEECSGKNSEEVLSLPQTTVSLNLSGSIFSSVKWKE